MKDQAAAYVQKMKGGARSPLTVRPINIAIGFIGGSVSIGLLALLTTLAGSVWIMAPFGASCVLAFAVWDAPLSQPRNLIGGHLISTFTGLVTLEVLGDGIWAMAIGVGAAISLMGITKTTHPPAGADPLVVIMAGSGWSFLFTPVLAGSVLIVIVALLVNNAVKERRYPTFWW
ncbi:HPP family protein [Paenibacillus sp. NPDC093718]|uniref:HPP family protein n=1 Tax=Paenibacillus sp. NPDC093718 TaxID=3390601 RepID=UPI003D074FC2